MRMFFLLFTRVEAIRKNELKKMSISISRERGKSLVRALEQTSLKMPLKNKKTGSLILKDFCP